MSEIISKIIVKFISRGQKFRDNKLNLTKQINKWRLFHKRHGQKNSDSNGSLQEITVEQKQNIPTIALQVVHIFSVEETVSYKCFGP